MHASESELPRILSALGQSIGDEFVALRRVSIKLTTWADDRTPLRSSIERALTAAVFDCIEAARRTSPRGYVSATSAWFPSEAAAVAGYLSWLAAGGEGWPFAAFRELGSTWQRVLESCAARELAFAGDVLAEAVSMCGLETLLREAPDPSAIVAIWTQANAPRLERVPPSLEPSWLSTLELPESREQAMLTILAHLVTRWPPARALAIDPDLLRELSTRVGRSKDDSAMLDSRAGGLLVWAALMSHTGIGPAIASAYPEAKARRAVRWALGRALENPSLDPRDPLLLLFAGEVLDGAVFPDLTLRGSDPEPLRMLGLRTLAEVCPDSQVRIAPFGDGFVAITEPAIVVDWEPNSTMDAAIVHVAQRFIAATGAPPTSIETQERIARADADLIHAVDVPALPDPWRTPIMTLASTLQVLLQREWRASRAECRGWRARVSPGGVVLSSRDAARVANGAWLRSASVDIEGRALIVSTT